MSKSPDLMVHSKSDSKLRRSLNNDNMNLQDNKPMPSDRELVNKFRHVYAGRGGWYGYKNGPSGPISLLNTPFLTPRHRKELLRQAADMTEGNRKGRGSDRRVRRLGSPLGKYNVLRDDDLVTSRVQVTDYSAVKQENQPKLDISNNHIEHEERVNTTKDATDLNKEFINKENKVQRSVTNDEKHDKTVKSVKLSSSELNQGENGSPENTGEKKIIPEDNEAVENKGPHLMTEKEAKRYRKLQLFSRMSQEAQFAMNELKKDCSPKKKAHKSKTDSDNREEELTKANQELSKFAQTLTTGARVSDSDDGASDAPNYDTSSGKGQSSRSSTKRKSSARSRRPRTRLPLIGANIQDYVTKDTGTYKTNIPGVGRYKVIPPGGGNVFEITPPGYDSRYNVRRRDLDVDDETPEEIRNRAIEKCNNWLEKYH